MFEELIQESWSAVSGATERLPAQILWPEDGGETVTAWNVGVNIAVLNQMRGPSDVQTESKSMPLQCAACNRFLS